MCGGKSREAVLFEAAVMIYAHKDVTVDYAVKRALEIDQKLYDLEGADEPPFSVEGQAKMLEQMAIDDMPPGHSSPEALYREKRPSEHLHGPL